MQLSRPDRQRVVPILSLIALILLFGLDYASVQPNRIVAGTGYGVTAALGTATSIAMGLTLALLVAYAWLPLPPTLRRWMPAATTLLTTSLLASLPLTLWLFEQRQLSADSPYARTSIDSGFWCLLFLLVLILIEGLHRLRAGFGVRLLVLLAILGGWALCLYQGGLAHLSLVMEYHSRADQMGSALIRHLELALGSVGLSLILGFGLALQVSRRPRWQRPVFGLVNFIQTIPSLALFGLLIAPLSALSSAFPALQAMGIRGIGWAPAALALIGYSLLPMVRNTYVALSEVPAELLEAGRGMGLSDGQLFRQVKLPLALPVIIEGVRVTTIQAIGLTAVAALIGAGGFGTFIFQGLGQAAMDLVLLGALPTIALAVAADALFSWLAARMRPAGV